MEQKLLFFDIDGTLITEGNGARLPESTRIAVKKAREQGHLLFINTGRTRASLPKKVLELGFDGYVCGCGTHIFLNEEEIFVAKLTSEFCKKTVREIRKYDVPVLYEAADAIYFDKEYSEADKWKEAAEKVFHFKGKDIEEVLESDTKVYDKVLLILKPSQKNERLKKYLSEDFTCIDRSNDMYEMIQKNYSKGTGIHFLCEYLGKTIEDCYAFGDSENDRAMLEAVVHSVAMGNGEEAIKKSCSYIAEDIEEDGLYKAMQHFGLLGEISN